MSVLYLAAVVLALFLAMVLATRKKKTAADKVLCAWLALTGLHLLSYYIRFTGHGNENPALAVAGFPLPLVHGPFIYLYTLLQTTGIPFRKKHLLHFVPVILCYGLFLEFFLLPAAQQADVYRAGGKGFETTMAVSRYAIYISGILYSVLALRRLLDYRKGIVHRFSNTEKINFNWLLYLILWIMAIWTVILFLQEDELIYATAALFVLWLGYFGIKQVRVFSQPGDPLAAGNGGPPEDSRGPVAEAATLSAVAAAPKYQKSNLSDAEAENIHRRLKQIMSEEKPYTNPDLTLNELARSLHVHPNLLSQVINSREKRNFYDLVNMERVNEFIRLVSQPLNRQYTLLGIALDCGFNSKASFNRNFKKHTGLSPRDFLKRRSAA
jgi:AraC-like DNA-binding protein